MIFWQRRRYDAGQDGSGVRADVGTNVLGHHALLRLLLPALRKSASTREAGETRWY